MIASMNQEKLKARTLPSVDGWRWDGQWPNSGARMENCSGLVNAATMSALPTAHMF
jgi:hypothetical protein